FNHELAMDVGIAGSHETVELFVQVGTPEALVAGADGVVSERAQLVVATMDAARVRAYLLAVVHDCNEPTLREGVEVLTRYFRTAGERNEPPAGSLRHARTMELRAFDPPWAQDDVGRDVHLTFGVGERGRHDETECTVSVVTPEGLRARDAARGFVLAHRATLIVECPDMDLVRKRLVDIVERRCTAPTMAH